MTQVYGANISAAILAGTDKGDGSYLGGRIHVFREIITLASQPTSNTIPVATPDKGMIFLFGMHTTSASLGSTTVAAGITGSTAKYKAAATFTATDTPTLFGKAAAQTKLTAAELVFLTLAAATAPSSGTYVVDTYWAST
jgi:hypothetical protein